MTNCWFSNLETAKVISSREIKYKAMYFMILSNFFIRFEPKGFLIKSNLNKKLLKTALVQTILPR